MQIIFSLTSLQQYTAVTDIYFIIRKVQPYLLNSRWGGQGRGRKKHTQEWVLKLKLRTGAHKKWHRCHPPKWQRLSFPRGEWEGRVIPAPPSMSILGSQMAFQESRTLSSTGCSYSWKFYHYVKRNCRNSCSRCGAGRWDQKAVKKPTGRNPTLVHR